MADREWVTLILVVAWAVSVGVIALEFGLWGASLYSIGTVLGAFLYEARRWANEE